VKLFLGKVFGIYEMVGVFERGEVCFFVGVGG
jgi:hypothetical protein